MKKNLTKKLMLSVLTLAFAVVSLGASTFAWFTLEGNAKIGEFEADVVGGYGLDVSVTAYGETEVSKWYTGSIPADDIAAAIVKTTGKADWQFDAATPEKVLTESQSFTNVKGEVAKGSYAIFDLHFKLTDANATKKFNLYLNEFSVVGSGEQPWTVDHEYLLDDEKVKVKDENDVEPGQEGYIDTFDYKYKVGLNDTPTYKVESAARVAFIEGSSGYNKIFQQANNALIAAGNNTVGFNEYGAWNYYDQKLGESNTTLEFPDSNLNEALESTEDKLNTWTNWEQEKEVVRAELSGSQTVVLTVIVWIEGWDGECINAIFSQNLKVSLSFGIKQQD